MTGPALFMAASALRRKVGGRAVSAQSAPGYEFCESVFVAFGYRDLCAPENDAVALNYFDPG